MRIGIDFDDVVFNCNAALLKFHNEKYGTSYTYEDILDFDFSILWKVTAEEAHKRFAEFISSRFHLLGQPVTGAIQALRGLAKHFELYVITGRIENTKNVTEDWISKHCPDLFQEVIFTNHFGGTDEQRKTKGSVCTYLNLEAFVDDAPIHAESVATTKTRSLLLTKPWNKKFNHPKIERVHSWDEIPPIIMK